MFQVTQIQRFLPERGLRFRNLGFCGHDLMYTLTGSDLQLNSCTCTALPGRLPEGLAFFKFPPFLEGHGAFSVIRILRLRSASEI